MGFAEMNGIARREKCPGNRQASVPTPVKPKGGGGDWEIHFRKKARGRAGG